MLRTFRAKGTLYKLFFVKIFPEDPEFGSSTIKKLRFPSRKSKFRYTEYRIINYLF